GHVVLTGRDKDLGAGYLVGAICLGLGLGLQQTQIGTTVRLGQAHGAGPLTTDQLRQVSVLLLLGAVLFDGGDSAVRQARIHRPGPVGGTDHFGNGDTGRARQALAAELLFATHGRPATFDILRVGFLETFRRGDVAVIPLTAFLVAG